MERYRKHNMYYYYLVRVFPWQSIMKNLVTGAAGFIGSALSIRLLERGDTVIGIDNHNDYYDPA